MTDDRARAAPPETSQADSLYGGFPDFSAWGELSSSDLNLWNRFAASLVERRKAATPEALKAAVDVAVRAAALDTGAIEGLYSVDRGFTMTVALQQLAWEQAIEERGADVRELFEAQLEAYELVLDAVTRRLPITEAWIRALHEKLCAPQKSYRVLTDVGWQEQNLPKGQYKTLPNHVRLSDGTFHAYAPVDRVPSEMHRLIEQIRTPEFEAAHPVLQASYVHYAFVVIHPFADGNGRVARALASTFFYRALSVPLVIFANQRPAYLDALHAADLGDHQPVLAFFQDRGIDTMQLIGENLRTAEARLEEIATRIRGLTGNQRDIPFGDQDHLADRLLVKTAEQFMSLYERLSLPPEVSLSTYRSKAVDFYPAYRSRPILGLRVRLEGATPIEKAISFLIAAESSNPFTFLIKARGNDDTLQVRLSEVYPEVTNVFTLRLTHWVERQLRDILREFEQQISSP